MDSVLAQEVWRRAQAACEYCRLPQGLTPLPFQIDHIIARQHGGETTSDNLALACLPCNKHKGPNIAGLDPATGALLRLFHPRRDVWTDHFVWSGAELVGRTPIGRTTIRVLAINHPDYLAVREALLQELGTLF